MARVKTLTISLYERERITKILLGSPPSAGSGQALTRGTGKKDWFPTFVGMVKGEKETSFVGGRGGV